MTVAEIIFAKENELRLLRSEAAFAMDERGNVILEKSAEPDAPYELAFTDEEVARMCAASGVVFTHNHPMGWNYSPDDARHEGHSFSPHDILLACRAELAEIRAVTPRFRYSLKPPPGRWNEDFWDMLWMVYQTEHDSVDNDLAMQVLENRLTVGEYEVLLEHRVWERVAKTLGLDYNRVEE